MKNYTITALLLITFIARKGEAQTYVQTATKFQTSTSNTISQSFASSSTSGNLIVVHLDWDKQTVDVSTVTDNKGNTYKKIIGSTNWNGSSYDAELWYAYNITGGNITVTAKLTANTNSFFQIYISEYGGIISAGDPLDQSSVATGNSSAVSSGAKTTTYNHELIYGVAIGASGTLSTGAGFTNRSTANSNIVEDKTGNAVGSYSANFTSAGGNWIAQMATFITTSSLIILPVDLLSFTGKCGNGQIKLEWATASETGNDHFTVESSETGTGWKVAGIVNSAGNSSSVQQYSFTAPESNGEFSYFRLAQTDKDGKTKYFNTLQVANCSHNITGVSIFPNPSNGNTLYGKINLKFSEAYSIEVYDSQGKMVYRAESGQQAFAFNFTHTLLAGLYFARFSSSHFSTTQSFLVRH
jgi:hypothetical protein